MFEIVKYRLRHDMKDSIVHNDVEKYTAIRKFVWKRNPVGICINFGNAVLFPAMLEDNKARPLQCLLRLGRLFLWVDIVGLRTQNSLHVPTLITDLLSLPRTDVTMKWRAMFDKGVYLVSDRSSTTVKLHG